MPSSLVFGCCRHVPPQRFGYGVLIYKPLRGRRDIMRIKKTGPGAVDGFNLDLGFGHGTPYPLDTVPPVRL